MVDGANDYAPTSYATGAAAICGDRGRESNAFQSADASKSFMTCMPAALTGESRACIARGDRIGRPAFVAPELRGPTLTDGDSSWILISRPLGLCSSARR